MSYVLGSTKVWIPNLDVQLEQRLNEKFYFVQNKVELTPEFLSQVSPKKIFFTHWSEIISKDVYENYPCVVFHMTDLPFGRGGSPLQNLIALGYKTTMISALKCTKGLDEGPIYLKRPLSLEGSAQEIFIRANEVIREMIVEIVRSNPTPIPQEGEPVIFKRRTPAQSEIGQIESIDKLYDFIRMLDADNYPKAELRQGRFLFRFSNAQLLDGKIRAEVEIIERDEDSK